MAYITLADAKAYLGIPTGTTTDDTLLTGFISPAQAYIDAHCNRTFEASADTTRRFDASHEGGDLGGEHNRSLLLDADLCQITSITNGDGTVITSTDYTTVPRHETPWYEIRLKRFSDYVWEYEGDPENAIVVVGRWAYSVTAPADVAQACTRLVAWLYRQKDNNADVGAPQMTDQGTWLMPSQMPKDIAALLAPYRRIAT